MTDEETKLARELTAAKQWEWRDGMLACGEGMYANKEKRVVLDDGFPSVVSPFHHETYESISTRAYPDLSDPATKGVLLEMVRKARGRPDFYVEPRNNPLRWIGEDYEPPSTTEGAALAKALLAAWGEDD